MGEVIEGRYKVVGEPVEVARLETPAEREDRKWAEIEARAKGFASLLGMLIFAVVWYGWAAKPVHRWLWNASGALLHWLGWGS